MKKHLRMDASIPFRSRDVTNLINTGLEAGAARRYASLAVLTASLNRANVIRDDR